MTITPGVIGEFEHVAVFPSFYPGKDEKKAHMKLKKYSMGKEYFELEPIDAVYAVHQALGYRDPVFNDKEVETEFYQRKQENRLKINANFKVVDVK